MLATRRPRRGPRRAAGRGSRSLATGDELVEPPTSAGPGPDPQQQRPDAAGPGRPRRRRAATPRHRPRPTSTASRPLIAEGLYGRRRAGAVRRRLGRQRSTSSPDVLRDAGRDGPLSQGRDEAGQAAPVRHARGAAARWSSACRATRSARSSASSCSSGRPCGGWRACRAEPPLIDARRWPRTSPTASDRPTYHPARLDGSGDGLAVTAGAAGSARA